ncbi:MAG: DUF115 domain-containing protein [Treponema sp.]|nr:DUF115 domain-containing protein [Treponema sp.]
MKRSGDSGDNTQAGRENPADCGDSPKEIPARRGFSISYKGKSLLSRVDPVAHGERVAAELLVKEDTLYFCPSPLYGYGLDTLLRRLPESSVVLCVEADEALFQISQRALGELGGGGAMRPLALVQAAQPAQPGELCAFVRETWGQRRFRRVEEIRLGGGWQVFPHLYEELIRALRREIAVEWGNAMTLIRLGRLYARNFIRNLAFLPDGEDIAALNFGPSPVLALGAGPSLDYVLDGLATAAAAGRRFAIVCVDTCLQALNERSIRPDLVVILESQHWNIRDFSGARGRNIDAAIDLSALPASARVLAGKRFFFATPWTELSLFTRLGQAGLLPRAFAPLGSVALSAVALALSVSCGPVLTAGIDFSFTLDAYHARSTPQSLELERSQRRTRSGINAAAALRDGTFAARSKAGHSVRSDPAMRNYRDLFQQEFGGNPRLLDISGPGLPLGVKTISLPEAAEILNGGADTPPRGPASSKPPPPGREAMAAFIRREMAALTVLRDALSGERPLNPARVDELLDTASYLWAHFPECAGAGGRRPATADISFLKRVRTEIEPFLKCWEMAAPRRA